MQSLIDRVIYKLAPKTPLGDRFISWRDFRKAHGRSPSYFGDLNDVIYWLKTSPQIRRSLRRAVTDKEHAKQYVREKIGDEYNVPTLAVLKCIEEVRAYQFPDNCVVKPTHTSGGVQFRRDGSELNYEQMAEQLKTNYYHWTREANYKDLQPKLIVEPFIFDGAHCEDFKIFCVHGEPKIIWVDQDRHTGHKRNFYSPDWTPLPVEYGHPRGPEVERPATLEKMLEIARALSRDFNIIRVDLYTDGERVLVGELTNTSCNALDKFQHGAALVTKLLFDDDTSSIVRAVKDSRAPLLGNTAKMALLVAVWLGSIAWAHFIAQRL